MTVCGRNFGFDKTESFKPSLVTVEVAGAPCRLSRQESINRCVCVCCGSGSTQRPRHAKRIPGRRAFRGKPMLCTVCAF